MSDVNNELPPLRLWPVALALVGVVALWVINLCYGLSITGPDRGLFGDMFGAVNALFSGLAFAGVMYAIVMQRHEILIAKREIAYTKTILDEQQKQLSIQNQQSKRQAFENTYFQMVRLFSDITNNIDLHRLENKTPVITRGKDVFPVFLDRLRKAYNPPEKSLYGSHDFDAAYEQFYEKHNTELGHYFRLLYNIMNFINESDVENQKFYAKILRAQLSDSEIAILFYNGLSKNGILKFKPLIERYGLLKNLNQRDIFAPELKDRYALSAFGKQAT